MKMTYARKMAKTVVQFKIQHTQYTNVMERIRIKLNIKKPCI